MGTWGLGFFENDDAADFLYDLVSQQTHDPLRHAFEEVLIAERWAAGYPEKPECDTALAAAEVVATLLGRPHRHSLREGHLTLWANDHPISGTDELVALAIAAIKQISVQSELKDLWYDESLETYETWYTMLWQLIDRIGGNYRK